MNIFFIKFPILCTFLALSWQNCMCIYDGHDLELPVPLTLWQKTDNRELGNYNDQQPQGLTQWMWPEAQGKWAAMLNSRMIVENKIRLRRLD